MSIQNQFLPGAVIFDMDGLLLDTEGPVIALWVEVGRQLGWDVTEETVFRTVGINEAATRAVFIGEYGPEFPYDEARSRLIQIYLARAEKEGIPHRPGLAVLLDHLAGLGIPLGIATSSDRETALWKLRCAGIGGRFSVLVCGDEAGRGKPAPDIFLCAAERLGKAPAECIGFEDSPAGLTALHAAGIRSVFIKDMVEPPAEVLRTVWRRYGDLAEAAALFGKGPVP
jgi:HAD superfamily hydrolase (TIGR01509 family)